MILKKQIEFEAIFFIAVGAIVGFLLVSPQMKKNTVPTTLDVKAAAPTPTPIFIPTSNTLSQISSDGTKKVSVKITTNKDTSKTYEVATAEDGTAIFKQTLPADESISIPFNTWSADNHYFFIQKMTKNVPTVLVFKADGEPFSDTEAYIDLTDVFAKRAPNALFDQATGWAEGHLIIINTKLTDGTQALPAGRQGTSYWFEVPSKAVIPLSTKF